MSPLSPGDSHWPKVQLQPRVSVIVPWRSQGDRDREQNWERVQQEWDGWHPYTCDDGGQPFSRAASINQGVQDHPADVYVIADADIIIDAYQVQRAVAEAKKPGMVLAFDRYVYLTKVGSKRVIQGIPGEWEAAWSLTWTVSQCVVVSAETWDLSGGMDPRFRAWGMEDNAFKIACETLAGPTRRIAGSAYHLWHHTEPNRPTENVDLLRCYEAAAGKPEELRSLMTPTVQGWNVPKHLAEKLS